MTYPEQKVHDSTGGGTGGGGGKGTTLGGDRGDFSSVLAPDTIASNTPETMSIVTSVGDDTVTIKSWGGAPSVISEKTTGGAADAEANAPRSCRTGYCRNMKFFVACLAGVYLVRSALLQYTEDVLTHIGRRYPITANELYFVVGCERIGFVAALLFVAFFGNRMHKPAVISVGVLICAFGSILMAVPFFISGPRLYDTRISQFAVAGLCKQTNGSQNFQTQCDLIAYKTEDDGTASFTLISISNLLIGVGGALFASLGLAYIEEGSKAHIVPLYFCLVLGMHGYGRFIGNLLAAWFTSLPESMNMEGSKRLLQDYAVYDQERVGRWWLGFPLLASLLVCLSLTTLWFPKYINIPDWVKRRRAKRARIQAEMERRQRLKVLASKKRHTSDANGHKGSSKHRSRRGKGHNDRSSSKGSSANGDVKKTLGVVNEVDATADEVHANGGVTNVDIEVTIDDTQKFRDSHDVDDLPDVLINPKPREADTSSLEVNMDDTQNDDRVQTDFADEDKLKRRKKKSPTLDTSKVEPVDGNSEHADNKEDKRKSTTDDAEQKSKRSSRNGSGRRYKKKSSNRPTTVVHYKPRKIRFRKENIKDLPHTVVNLLHNLRIVIVIFGAVLGGFYFNGYLATLPEYIHVQFQRSWGGSLIIAGVTGHLAMGLGTQIGGALMFRFRTIPMVRVTLVMICCILTCCLLTLVSMAFHCRHDTSPNSTAVALCAKDCECDSYKVQYEPLCGGDGKTYPSPCHGGCKAIEKTETAGVFKFTGCACIPGGDALQGACEPSCSSLIGFSIVTFVAVVIISTGIIPVFILLFRSVRSRSKSFAVGFAVWSIYIFSTTLGPVAFRYPRDGRCRQWGEDCLEERVCWLYDLQPYRLVVNGIAAAFLFATGAAFLLVFLHLKRSKAKKLKKENQQKVLQLETVEDGDAVSEVAIQSTELNGQRDSASEIEYTEDNDPDLRTRDIDTDPPRGNNNTDPEKSEHRTEL